MSEERNNNTNSVNSEIELDLGEQRRIRRKNLQNFRRWKEPVPGRNLNVTPSQSIHQGQF